MRFHGVALSGGLILSSLSGAAAQDTTVQSTSGHAQPSVRRRSEVEASGARKDSMFGVLKKLVPVVDIPVPFRFSNNQIPDRESQKDDDDWSSRSSADQDPGEHVLDDQLVASRSSSSKTLVFPRRALSAVTQRSASGGSSKTSSTARVTSSGRIVKTSTKKTISVIRGAPFLTSRRTTSQRPTTSTHGSGSSKESSSSNRASSSIKIASTSS